MSSTKRNKVKSFGDHGIDHEEMADRFLVVGALKAPPPVSNRVKGSNNPFHCFKLNHDMLQNKTTRYVSAMMKIVIGSPLMKKNF